MSRRSTRDPPSAAFTDITRVILTRAERGHSWLGNIQRVRAEGSGSSIFNRSIALRYFTLIPGELTLREEVGGRDESITWPREHATKHSLIIDKAI